MGLFRLAIVAAIGVSLLPSDSEQQEKLYTRAADAAHWTITFCSRNEATCTQAASLWGQFVKKAQFGAKLAYDALSEKNAQSGIESGIETGALERPRTPQKSPSQTLNRSDLEPVWRGGVVVRPPVR